MITTITYNSQSRIIRTEFSSVRHNYDYYYNPQFQFIIKSYSNRVPISTHNYDNTDTNSPSPKGEFQTDKDLQSKPDCPLANFVF